MSKKNIIMNFIIQKLKSKHTSLKKYTNWAKLVYFSLVLREWEEKNKQIFCTIVTIAQLWIRYRLKKIMNISFSYWEWLSWVQLAVFSLYWVLYFGFILCISGKLGTQVSRVSKYQVQLSTYSFCWGIFDTFKLKKFKAKHFNISRKWFKIWK